MVLTATSSPLGFSNIVGYTTGKEEMYVPGDPGDSLTRGDMLTATVGEGILDIAAGGEAPFCEVLKTVALSAMSATTPFPIPEGLEPCYDESNTLVLVRPLVAAGIPIRVVTFSGHTDDTVASYTAATPEIVMTTGCVGDDDPNGALVYIYDGPGAGQVGVVADYTHAGTHLVLHRAFKVAPTSESSIIVLHGEAANDRGIGFFTRIDADNNNLTAADGANDGDWMVFADFRTIGQYLQQLTLPVIPASAMYE